MCSTHLTAHESEGLGRVGSAPCVPEVHGVEQGVGGVVGVEREHDLSTRREEDDADPGPLVNVQTQHQVAYKVLHDEEVVLLYASGAVQGDSNVRDVRAPWL